MSYDSKTASLGHRNRSVQGIPIHETLVEYDVFAPQRVDETAGYFAKHLKEVEPKTTLINSPAVWVTESHIAMAEETLKRGGNVKLLVCDALFPLENENNRTIRDKYISLVKKMDTYSVSNNIKHMWRDILETEPGFFPTPFDQSNIVTSKPPTPEGFITLVNHHPIKGRQIFDIVAQMMPDKEFMVVENWPDVPEYIPPTPNIRFQRFLEDPRELWQKVSILVVPSLCQEGRARVVTEAMLNGIPVIAHRIGSLPELESDGLVLVDPPEILDYELRGTVLYPRLMSHEAEDTAKRIVEELRNLTSQNNWHAVSKLARNSALSYCKRMDDLFDCVCVNWVNT